MAIGYGSRGEEVKRYQRELNAAGANPPLVVDGIWGPKTQAAHEWYLEQQPDDEEPTGDVRMDTGSPEQYAEDSRFFGIGGQPQIWYNSDTGESYLVFDVPGTDPPVPMYWRIESDEHLQAYFGDNPVMYDRVVTADELTRIGAIYNGVNTEIVVTDGDPMRAMTERIERDMDVRPYLQDPEVAAIIAAAAIEGVAPTQADFDKTEWWRTHTDRERSWLLMSASDPKTAQQRLDSQRVAVRQLLVAAGVYDPPDDLVNLLADNFTTGAWDEITLNNQINKIADPAYDGTLEPDVQEFLQEYTDDGGALDTNTDQERWVRETALKWLGPVFGSYTDKQIADIAGRIRNDPNYRDEWISSLQQQRVTMFPEYTDPMSSYDDIAQPWRSVWTSVLGETADESSSQFQQIVQQNNLTEARRELRRYGMTTGNDKVQQDALSSLASAMNYGVNRVV